MENYNDIYSNSDSVKDTGFYDYLRLLNMENDSNLLILSPVHHYYYNLEEVKSVGTLIHMKELNRVGDLKRFIDNTVHVLSGGSKFIGCFMDNDIHKNIIYRSRLLYWLGHCLSTKVNRYLSRKKIAKLFLKYGFDIMDISEIEGICYFCVKKL